MGRVLSSAYMVWIFSLLILRPLSRRQLGNFRTLQHCFYVIYDLFRGLTIPSVSFTTFSITMMLASENKVNFSVNDPAVVHVIKNMDNSKTPKWHAEDHFTWNFAIWAIFCKASQVQENNRWKTKVMDLETGVLDGDDYMTWKSFQTWGVEKTTTRKKRCCSQWSAAFFKASTKLCTIYLNAGTNTKRWIPCGKYKTEVIYRRVNAPWNHFHGPRLVILSIYE